MLTITFHGYSITIGKRFKKAWCSLNHPYSDSTQLKKEVKYSHDRYYNYVVNTQKCNICGNIFKDKGIEMKDEMSITPS